MTIIKAIFEMRVVYEPSTHSIYDIKNKKYQHSLAVPASLCLLSLLENKNEVVSHSTLLSQVWESRGMAVSANTVYQNISLLRKSLADLGLQSEIIKTIPKRGFVIPEDILVDVYYDESFEDNSNKENIDNNEQKSASRNNTNIKITSLLKNFFLNYYLLTFLFLISFMALSKLVLSHNAEIPKYSFSDYQEVKKLENCHILIKPPIKDDFNIYMISLHNIKCEDEKWWYFTYLSPNPEVSILKCSRKLDLKTDVQKNFCHSDFYMDGVK